MARNTAHRAIAPQPIPEIGRRRFICLCGAALASSLLPGCQHSTIAPLAVAAHTWPGYEGLFLSRQMGWLAPELVDLVETRSATDSMRALSEGRAHAAALTLDEVLRARAKGMPLTIILAFDISAGADALLAHPGTRLTDLAGKRIGVEDGAVGTLVLTAALRQAGLSPTEVQRIPLTADHHYQAWKAGEVDAVITFDPVITQLQALGAVKLFDSRQMPDMIVDVLAVHTPLLRNPAYLPALRELVGAHFKALEHLRQSPDDYAYRTSAHLNLPAEQVLNSYKGLILPDVNGNRHLLAGERPALLASAHNILAELSQNDVLHSTDMLGSLLDPDFLPRETAS